MLRVPFPLPTLALTLTCALACALSSCSAAGCGAGPGDVDGGAREGEGEGGGETPLSPANPDDPDNARLDVDCDGLSDAEEFGTLWPGGGATDPEDPDSDDDGVRDGVEAGRTQSPDARCAAFPGRARPDEDPATTSHPLDADSDDDGVPDGAEDADGNGRVDAGESSPTNPDTDGDGVCDGPRSVAGACLANDDATVIADADDDGLPDRRDAHPDDPDADDDGLCDGSGAVRDVCDRGEDLDDDGLLDPGESDPARSDTDCDGLADDRERARGTDPSRVDSDGDGTGDGVETGSNGSADPTCPPGSGVDADPTTTSDPLVVDSDGDSVPDGQEDGNGNGRRDDGELDPGDPDDGDDATVRAVCAADNLVPLRPIVSVAADVQMLVVARPADAFAASGTVVTGGAEVGVFGVDAATAVGFVAVRVAVAGDDALDRELAVRAALGGVAPLGPPLTQTTTTWDGFPAVLARYDQAAPGGLKARLGALAAALVPGATTTLGTADDIDAPDGFRLEVEVVRRDDDTTIAVVGLLPLDRVAGDGRLPLRNVVDGSALGRARDPQGAHCERQQAEAFTGLDILWTVDNSASMADEQAAVGAAFDAFAAKLDNSTVDFRAAVVGSGFKNPGGQTSGCQNRTCENDRFAQCRRFTRDIDELRGHFTPDGPTWIGAGGTCNQQREEIFGSAEAMLQDSVDGRATFFPPSATERGDRLRDDARLLLIALGDADDQKVDITSLAAGAIDDYEAFFRSRPFGVSMGGILCPDGSCGERQNNPHVAATLINRFGGVLGELKVASSIAPAIDAILDAALADVSPYVLADDAISASVKVALDPGATAGPCDVADVPRSRAHGFDYDPRTRTVQFFGDCRPLALGSTIAVSYRTWRTAPPVVDGACLCQCPGNLACTAEGADSASNTCGCQCTQSLTCAEGFRFDEALCACVCDVDAAAALCPATHVLDPATCACACGADCNGTCTGGDLCRASLCVCQPIDG